jgi:hypothetical protein
MARMSGWALAVVAAVALTRVVLAQGDTVQGAATVNATKVVLASGMAVSYKAADGQLVSVLLSDKPADRKAFAADTTTSPGEPLVPGVIEGAWKGQHLGKRLSGFTFTFGGKSNIVSEEFLVGGRNNTFSLGAEEYVLEVKSTSPRLVGRIRTKTPVVDAGSTKAGLDVTFDLAVERRP